MRLKEPDLVIIRELTPKDILKENLSDEIIIELFKNGYFKGDVFTFVGISCDYKLGITIIGYPKYMPQYPNEISLEELVVHVDLVCRVIEKAKTYLNKSIVSKSSEFSEYLIQENKEYVNKYTLANFIIMDYINNGIYIEKNKKNKFNSSKNINWEKTVDIILPVIDRDILYLETIGNGCEEDHSQLITKLHIWILNCCLKLLKGLGKYKEVEVPDILQNFNDEDLQRYVPYIQKKISSLFNNRQIHLLKALITWCDQSIFYQEKMGTTTFDRIWEFAIDKVFGNINNTKSGRPIYCIEDKKYQGVGESIPDTLRVFSKSEEKEGYIGILDAKYYCPEIKEKSMEIYGAPANSDISKQIDYYRHLKSKYNQSYIKFTNAFLFPKYTMENLYENIGYVTKNDEANIEIQNLLSHICIPSTDSIDKVLLYRINVRRLYQYCLLDKKVDDISFYKDFIVPYNILN